MKGCARFRGNSHTRARAYGPIQNPYTTLHSGNPQLEVTYTAEDYERAATVLWGPAGAYAVREYAQINSLVFDDELPALPIVIGITAYGKCLGLTRYRGTWDAGHLPRITLASNLFAEGHNVVRDVLIHEALHVRLRLAGESSKHNDPPWCEAITRLSPVVLGHPVAAAPVKPRRIGGKVVRRHLDGHLPQNVLATWPGSLRGPDWDRGEPLRVETWQLAFEMESENRWTVGPGGPTRLEWLE